MGYRRLVKPKTVTVYEDMWGQYCLRGINGMCCLGFVCAAQSDAPLNWHGVPARVGFGRGWLVSRNRRTPDFASKAAQINDGTFSRETKKRKLREHFRNHGIKLVFRKKAPKAYREKQERLAGFPIGSDA